MSFQTDVFRMTNDYDSIHYSMLLSYFKMYMIFIELWAIQFQHQLLLNYYHKIVEEIPHE